MQFNYIRFLSVSLAFIVSFSLFGQGQINLLNGKQIKADSIKANGDKFTYFKPNKQKEKSLKKDDVFSINYPDGKEEFVFVPDTVDGDINLNQMKFVIKGEQDARKYYHAPTATLGGVVVGVASGYFAYYGVIVPALSGVVTGLHQPHDYKRHVKDTLLTNNQFYVYGYRSIARKKKVKNALISGYISLTGSFIALGFFNVQIENFFYDIHPWFYRLQHH